MESKRLTEEEQRKYFELGLKMSYPDWLDDTEFSQEQYKAFYRERHYYSDLYSKYEEKFGKEPPRRLNFFKFRNQIKLLKSSLENGQELELSLDFIRSHIKQD